MGSSLINNGQCMLTIRNTAMALPESLERHIHDRTARLFRFGWSFAHIAVELRHERNPRLGDTAFGVQITCRSAQLVVRAESTGATAPAAFDSCIERLHQRLRRLAERESQRRRGRFGRGNHVESQGADHGANHRALGQQAGGENGQAQAAGSTAQATLDHALAPLIIRQKSHPSFPMTAVEAVEAMELLGHSFYLFIDKASGEPAVVYQRKAYTYGIVKLSEQAVDWFAKASENRNAGEGNRVEVEEFSDDEQIVA